MSELFYDQYTVFEVDRFYQENFHYNALNAALIQPVQFGVNFVSPTVLHSEQTNSSYFNVSNNFHNYSAASPALCSDDVEHRCSPRSYATPQSSPSPLIVPADSQSRPVPVDVQSPSVSSIRLGRSQQCPNQGIVGADEVIKKKGRCPHPGCGQVLKDLRTHILTHRSERPEKCPILTCEYHTKGFARKYDKDRHTLSHYRGVMVCDFCPGSGSPAQMCFNRTDIFKRHLISAHGVEIVPNRRNRNQIASSIMETNPDSLSSSKCSTCSAIFSNAQGFYEHLDGCVLNFVQREESSETINQQRLAEVESDEAVKKTMMKHQLLDATGPFNQLDDSDKHIGDGSYDLSNWWGRQGASKSSKNSLNTDLRKISKSGNVATTSSSAVVSKGSRAVVPLRRNKREKYPHSWGCSSSSIKTKKRVLCIFHGQRRLWKDEIMRNTEFEARLHLPDDASDIMNRNAYVTDLDIETIKRAEGVLNAQHNERGPSTDGPSFHLIGPPAVLLPELCE